MKKTHFIVLFLLYFAVIAPVIAISKPVKNEMHLDKVIAIINDDVITQNELEKEVNRVTHRFEAAKKEVPEKKVVQKQVLENMINEQINLQIAERMGIIVDDIALNKALTSIAKDNQMSLSEFQKEMENEGEDFEAFREEIKHQMILGRLAKRTVGKHIIVSDDEISHFLHSPSGQDQSGKLFNLGHILIALPGTPSPEQIHQAKKKAETIKKELDKGGDFTKIAIEKSQGSQALNGGELGWRKAAELPTLFAKQVFHMKKGEVKGPIRSPSGFHLIKLLGVKDTKQKHVVSQTHVRHILIKPNAIHSDNEVKTSLNNIRKQILKGKSFEELAKIHSQDPVSAHKGGDLGWVSPGEMVPEFENTMKSLEPGKISPAIKTQFGWHLIQVIERRKQDDTKEYIRKQARQYIYKRKFNEELVAWQRQQRDESFVKILI